MLESLEGLLPWLNDSWPLQGLEVDAAAAAVESNRSLGAPLGGNRSWVSPLAYQWIPVSQWGDPSGTFHTFLMHQSSFSHIMTEECAAGLTHSLLRSSLDIDQGLNSFQLPRTGCLA